MSCSWRTVENSAKYHEYRLRALTLNALQQLTCHILNMQSGKRPILVCLEEVGKGHAHEFEDQADMVREVERV